MRNQFMERRGSFFFLWVREGEFFFLSCIWCGKWTVHHALSTWTVNFPCKFLFYFILFWWGEGPGVNQQPPMHQLRMSPLKPFWGWTKNTSSLPTGFFFRLFSTPKFSIPTYLPPTYLPPPTSHSITRTREPLNENGRGGTFGTGTPAIIGAGVPATIKVGVGLPLLELERLSLLELECLNRDHARLKAWA